MKKPFIICCLATFFFVAVFAFAAQGEKGGQMYCDQQTDDPCEITVTIERLNEIITVVGKSKGYLRVDV